ncbi:AbiJ-NTD4 domain-containing protein [Wenyingzhuangia aestuarii]|uniref:AbiJ-NTD4 domain-containing protein n=1 Tax=Wenyingzhuangia aestuarii TaxID=1647582 RepID=UPI00143B1C05|nr:hypothetical protein [Wenyingzhuangia aestuarii]NJB84223.1 hypothetical protein [Wenyingzhuangia aestuarii]
MKFSERIKIIKAKESIQINSIDEDLKNKIWNVFHLYYIEELKERYIIYCYNFEYIKDLWHNFFKKPIDTIPNETNKVKVQLRKWFFECEWYEIYDFIEYSLKSVHFDKEAIIINYNEVLESEISGYRFINEVLSPITNISEINEIDEAISIAKENNMIGVNTHLENALRMLSDKTSPDYRNSIKESISAVESIAKTLSKTNKNSLGSALDKIKGQINLHPALERGFKQIYGYTSDGDGIRHALMEEANCHFEDAKYMLVSCSSFVNYLIAKGNKTNLLE